MSEAIIDWYAEEEAAERARYDAQADRADLTPITPAPDAWIVESHWRKHSDGYQPGPLRQTCRDPSGCQPVRTEPRLLRWRDLRPRRLTERRDPGELGPRGQLLAHP